MKPVDPTDPDNVSRQTVCFVADDDVAERFPSMLRYLQIGLIDEAIDAILVAPERSRAIGLAGGPTLVIPYHNLQWPLSRWGRRVLLEEIRRQAEAMPGGAPVIVHGLSASSAALAAEITDYLGGDLVLTVTSTTETSEPSLQRPLEAVSSLIAPTRAIHRATEASAFGRKKTEFIPLGVAACSTPSAFNNPQRAPALAYAGSLSNESGAANLLRAARRVLTAHPTLLVFIIGKGPAEGNLRHLAESLGMTESVTFTGRLEQWRSALEAADIFCVLSGDDTLREEPLQALADGLACVAPAEVACDGFIDEQTALLYSGGDFEQIADLLQRLLDDHAAARKLAAAAQSQTRSHNSISRMVSEHVRIYRKLHGRSDTLAIPTT